MKPEIVNEIFADAIGRYKIASVRILAIENPNFDFDRAMKTCEKSSFRFLEYQGEKFVLRPRKKLPSIESVVRCASVQEFVCQNLEHRRMLSKNDLKHFFPTLYRTGLPWGYYVDTSSKVPKLGLIRVDCKLLQLRRVLERTIRQIDKHLMRKTFARLIKTNRFMVLWLLPTQAKADSLELLTNRKHRQVLIKASASPMLFATATQKLANPDSPMSWV